MVRQGLTSQTPSGLVCLGHHETFVVRTYCLMPSPTQLYGQQLRTIVNRRVVAGGRHEPSEAHRVMRCLGLELKCQVLGRRGCRRVPPYWLQVCTVRAPGRDCDGATLNRGTSLYDRPRPCKAKAGCRRRTLTKPYMTTRLLGIHITSQCGRFTNGVFSCWPTGRLGTTNMEAVCPE